MNTMLTTEEESNCDFPLIAQCNSTVFEYYGSTAENLRIFGMFLYSFVLIILFLTLFTYLRHNIYKLYSTRHKLSKTDKRQQRFMLRQNTAVLLFLILGSALLLVYSYNGFLIDLDFDTTAGKLNGLVFSEAYSSLYLAHFFFQPTLRKLMGLSENISETRRLNNIFQGVIWFNILKLFPLCIILFKDLVSFLSFLAICQIHFAINCSLLTFMINKTLLTVINNIKLLNRHHSSTRNLTDKAKKVKSLLSKLRIYQYVIYACIVAFYIITIPICIRGIMENLGAMLTHSIYAMLVGSVTSLPLVAIFSRFIIPGTEECLSYGTSTKPLNSMGGTNQETLNPATDI
eukprot:maker-scaffold_45-snap-gene-1.109-mRNA-1 protein AED:0.00 eAED:0.00 QI:170/1/1/1/1/1/2/539/344